MKNIFALIFIATSVLNTLKAIEPPPPDTVGFAWQSELLQAPVLTGETEMMTILPNQEPFCFNKQIAVKLAIPGRVVEQCLYLDTKGGLIGHLKPEVHSTGGLCDIKPDDPDFLFFIYGLKGNTYQYKNTKKKNIIEHYVSTANSQTYLYQGQTAPANATAVLHLKTETRMYCDDKIKGKAYKFDGDNKVWFLFGREFPPTLVWKKFFGNFGVGYLFTDKGMYMVMEMTYDGYSYKIISAENVHTCFNPAPFQIMEDKFVAGRTAELAKERDKLAIEQSKLSSGDCIGERAALHQYKVEMLNKQELNLQNSQVGNAWQNVQTQSALMGMFDPLLMIRQSILETKVSICKAQINASRHPDDAGAQEKVSCFSNFVGVLEGYASRMEALDIQYAANPGQAYAEKSKLYMEVMRLGCG